MNTMVRVVMMPRDTNSAGTIFGGVILGHLDLAGAMEAMHRFPGMRFVTIALHEVVFTAPVFVGDLVSFRTAISRVGRTSVTVRILVEARRLGREGSPLVRVTEAEAVYVAVDENRRPVPVSSEAGDSVAESEKTS